MTPTDRIRLDVVTALRTGELEPIRLQARNGLHASAWKSLYERGEGQELVRQQYTGRYPFELLQNANGAACAGTRGRAHFVLTDTALIVADNGLGSTARVCRWLQRAVVGGSDAIWAVVDCHGGASRAVR
ncbi:MAG: hypothetical protein WCA46_19395 [Actinocatenispora sp.]